MKKKPMSSSRPKARTPAERAQRDCAINQFANQLNAVFGDEKMQQLKRETLESEISLRKAKLALKQWHQIQAGMKDASKQSELFGENASAAC